LERSFLSLMNADCTFPVGAHAQFRDGHYYLEAMLADAKDRCLHVALASEDGSDLPKRALEQLMEEGALTDKWWEA
jgi:hydroxymethylbilane synthase